MAILIPLFSPDEDIFTACKSNIEGKFFLGVGGWGEEMV